MRADGGAGSAAPRAPWIRGTKEEVARALARLSVEEARADYGHVGGVFSPAALRATPTLYRYAGRLRAAGMRAAEGGEGEEGEGGEEGAGGEGEAEEGPGEDATWRLRELAGEIAGEIAAEAGGEGGAQQEALQLALSVAARHGHAALARRALDLGAAPAPRPASKRRGAAATISGGLPSLHVACAAGHVHIAEMLLDAKASVTLLSAGGVPPLHAAAAAGALGAIELLVARGAPLKMPDDRRRPLPAAAMRAALTAGVRAGSPRWWRRAARGSWARSRRCCARGWASKSATGGTAPLCTGRW